MNALNNLLLPFEMEGDTAEEKKSPALFIFRLSTPSNYILKNEFGCACGFPTKDSMNI